MLGGGVSYFEHWQWDLRRGRERGEQFPWACRIVAIWALATAAFGAPLWWVTTTQ